MCASQILALCLLTLGRGAVQFAGAVVTHVGGQRDAVQLAGAGTHWENCRIDGPEGFFVEKRLLIGERQSCKFTCDNKKWEAHSSMIPSFFEVQEREVPGFKGKATSYCYCSLPSKRKAPLFKYRTSSSSSRQCSKKECWAQYLGVVDNKKDRDMKIGGIRNLHASCTDCKSKDDPKCQGRFGMVLPPAADGDAVQGTNGSAEEQQKTDPDIVADLKKFNLVVSEQEIADLHLVVAAAEEEEPVTPLSDASGDVLVVAEEPGNCVADEVDKVPSPIKVVEEEVDEDLPADAEQCDSHDEDAKRAGCLCNLANTEDVTLAVRNEKCEESSTQALQSAPHWECTVHPTTERCVAAYPTYSTGPVVSDAEEKPVVQQPVVPEDVNVLDPQLVVQDVEDTHEPVEPDPLKSFNVSEEDIEAINDTKESEEFGANLEEKVPDLKDDLPAQVKKCTQDKMPQERAPCICQLANGEDKAKQEDNCKMLAKEAKDKDFMSPYSCGMHKTEKQCVPVYDDGEEISIKKAAQPPKPCGEVQQTPWWIDHADFYSKLFTVDSAFLECNFVSKKHACLNTVVVDEQPGRAPYHRTAVKNGASSSVVTPMVKVLLMCNHATGLWIEPTVEHVQSCAYPMRAKLLKKGDANDDEPEQNQVLTYNVKSKDGKTRRHQVVIEPFDRYALHQLWVMDANGLIQSATDPSQCLTGTDPNAWLTSKSGWLESYLFTTSCTRWHYTRRVYDSDRRLEWWIGSEMADTMRDVSKATTCKTANSCCSLSFAAASRGWLWGEAALGNYFLTFPKASRSVTDWSTYTYLWEANGDIKKKYYVHQYGDGVLDVELKEYTAGLEVEEDAVVLISVGTRTDPNDGGFYKVMTHSDADPLAADLPIQEDFHLGSKEDRPKILKSLKMVQQDKELAVIDFWKSS